MGIDIKNMLIQLPKMLRDPEDTMAAMGFYKSVGGKAISDEMVNYIESSAEGQQFINEQKDIYPVLTNRKWLRALPENTLGHCYIDWADFHGLYPEGLNAMGEALGVLTEPSNPRIAYLEKRQQVLHDLYHVLTGYDRDSAGEVALLHFSAIQEKNRAMNIISWFGQILFILHWRLDLFSLRRQARERALVSPLLLVQDWENLLQMPIDDVRKQLSLYPAPEYKPLH